MSQQASSCNQFRKRSDNLKRHKRTFTGHGVAAPTVTASAPESRPTGKLQFTLQ